MKAREGRHSENEAPPGWASTRDSGPDFAGLPVGASEAVRTQHSRQLDAHGPDLRPAGRGTPTDCDQDGSLQAAFRSRCPYRTSLLLARVVQVLSTLGRSPGRCHGWPSPAAVRASVVLARVASRQTSQVLRPRMGIGRTDGWNVQPAHFGWTAGISPSGNQPLVYRIAPPMPKPDGSVCP